MEALRNAGLASLLGLLISAAPLVMALSFAFWPSERKLALMRPLSLAGTYAAVANILLGLLNGLASWVWRGRRRPKHRSSNGLRSCWPKGSCLHSSRSRCWPRPGCSSQSACADYRESARMIDA